MELANPLSSADVMNDFDSFLRDQDGETSPFNFDEVFSMEPAKPE